MTSHLLTVPLPSILEDDSILSQHNGPLIRNAPSRMCFYVETIKLYRILDRILSAVYQLWLNNSSTTGNPQDHETGQKHGSMDAIIELDIKLAEFESALPPFLSWRESQSNHEAEQQIIYQRQTNELHARFIHLKIMLYRPLFTQLCQRKDIHDSTSTANKPGTELSMLSGNMLYSSFATRCAISCVTAAIDFLDLTYETYQTDTTGAWWYNGLYASTAGIVLILARLCPTIIEPLSSSRIEKSFHLCEEILSHMASFSVSAQNTLKSLQRIYQQLVHIQADMERQEPDSTKTSQRDMPGLTNNSANQQDLPCTNNLGEATFEVEGVANTAMGGSFFDWDPGFDFIPDYLRSFVSIDFLDELDWRNGIS